jgi:hypothetical protein
MHDGGCRRLSPPRRFYLNIKAKGRPTLIFFQRFPLVKRKLLSSLLFINDSGRAPRPCETCSPRQSLLFPLWCAPVKNPHKFTAPRSRALFCVSQNKHYQIRAASLFCNCVLVQFHHPLFGGERAKSPSTSITQNYKIIQ